MAAPADGREVRRSGSPGVKSLNEGRRPGETVADSRGRRWRGEAPRWMRSLAPARRLMGTWWSTGRIAREVARDPADLVEAARMTLDDGAAGIRAAVRRLDGGAPLRDHPDSPGPALDDLAGWLSMVARGIAEAPAGEGAP